MVLLFIVRSPPMATPSYTTPAAQCLPYDAFMAVAHQELSQDDLKAVIGGCWLPLPGSVGPGVMPRRVPCGSISTPWPASPLPPRLPGRAMALSGPRGPFQDMP